MVTEGLDKAPFLRYNGGYNGVLCGQRRKGHPMVIGIIGANRSPNCGVNTTSDNNMETTGMGLFIEKISNGLSKEKIIVPMIGIKATDDIIEKLYQLL